MAGVPNPPPRPTEPLLPCSTLGRVSGDARGRDLLRVATAVVVGIALGLMMGFVIWGAR